MKRMTKVLLIGLAVGGAGAQVAAQDHVQDHATHEPDAASDGQDHAAHEPDAASDAQDHAAHEPDAASDAHAGHEPDAPDDPPVNRTPPPEALAGPDHAADALFDPREMAAAREQLRREAGGLSTHMILADRFEIGAGDGEEHYAWDLQGRFGGDIHQLSWKSEGGGELGGNADDVELQGLYSRAIAPFFDFQAGVRHDFRPSPQRSHLVVGVQGMLPYVFEVDAAAFVSEDGDIRGRFEAEYDMRIRQRLVLQPRVELDFAAQAVPEAGIGPGLGSVEGGLRLRYEIRREMAPYVGIAWERKRGGTADFARAAGEEPRSWKAVIGVRAWF